MLQAAGHGGPWPPIQASAGIDPFEGNQGIDRREIGRRETQARTRPRHDRPGREFDGDGPEHRVAS